MLHCRTARQFPVGPSCPQEGTTHITIMHTYGQHRMTAHTRANGQRTRTYINPTRRGLAYFGIYCTVQCTGLTRCTKQLIAKLPFMTIYLPLFSFLRLCRWREGGRFHLGCSSKVHVWVYCTLSSSSNEDNQELIVPSYHEVEDSCETRGARNKDQERDLPMHRGWPACRPRFAFFETEYIQDTLFYAK